MFRKSCSKNRNAVYGIIGFSGIGQNRVNCSNGTAFMISPGILATAAHLTHVGNDFTRPRHDSFEVIRAPDIGQGLERAQFIAEDSIRDIALIRIENPRSNACAVLLPRIISIGTNCGSLGFPLAQVSFTQGNRNFGLVERFQGANISAFITQAHPSGRQLSYYETDSLMYSGSSGCPGFVKNGKVFGVHIRSVVERPREDTTSSDNRQTRHSARLAISIWVPSTDILTFARNNRIRL